MPNLTVYMPAEAMPPQARLSQLTQQCTQLCTGILGAALERVHIVFVPCQHGVGQPIFAQVQYRLESFRTAQVMDDFMQQLDAAILRHTGCTARIRCFAYAAAAIHARN